MGQKVNPHGFRVGINAPWSSTWYASKKDFGKALKEDYEIRKYLKKNYYDAAISDIKISRAADTVRIDIHCGRVGVAVGRMQRERRPADNAPAAVSADGTAATEQTAAVSSAPVEQTGKGIDEINKAIRKILGNGKSFNVNVHEVKNQDLDAQLVAESIAQRLEKRTSFRRAMKFAMSRTMRAGAKGVKTMVSGRLDGAEIARSESYHEGSIPLQTIRADIDYGYAVAHTTYGVIGVKTWIYKGEIFGKPSKGGKN